MSAIAFLVRHRTVDLVAMTAAHALRESLGLGDDLIELRRDDAFVIEGPHLGNAAAWKSSCTAIAHWFNPNKHRFGLFEAEPAAADTVRAAAAFPDPWLTKLVATDRRDVSSSGPVLSRWLALPYREHTHAVTLAAWDLEGAVASLPPGAWPAEGQLVRLQLWTLALRAGSPQEAADRAERVAITQSRTQGLLVHPHMEGWTWVSSPWTLSQEPTVA